MGASFTLVLVTGVWPVVVREMDFKKIGNLKTKESVNCLHIKKYLKSNKKNSML